MPSTYEPIATTTLGSAAASITFSSISSSYTDLRVSWVIPVASGSDIPALQFNSDTAANYSRTTLIGDGASAASARQPTSDGNTGLWFDQTGTTTVQPSFYTLDTFSYAGSTYKTSLITTSSDRNGTGRVTRTVGLWLSTSTITTVRLYLYYGTNLPIGTTATLYGILKA